MQNFIKNECMTITKINGSGDIGHCGGCAGDGGGNGSVGAGACADTCGG